MLEEVAGRLLSRLTEVSIDSGDAKATITIVDFSGLALDTVTVTIVGTAHVLTEGTDWNRGASNIAAALSLAAAIDALDEVSASALLAVVTISAQRNITSLAISDAINMTLVDSSLNTIFDPSKNWEVNKWVDAIVEVEVDDVHYYRTVASNTADTLTITALPAGHPVTPGAHYNIRLSTHIVLISGQTVTISSGNIAVVSGNVAVVSGEIHVMSGQLIAKISGETIIAKVSGEVVQISGQAVSVSGNVVKVSGETVIAKVSGETLIAKVSGETVVTTISGNVVGISGETVIAKISGEVVTAKVSGETIVTSVSGNVVIAKVSGQTVIVQSGSYVMADISGQVVQVSGQIVTAKVSGETVSIQTPTMLKTGPVRTLISASGGVVLHSGAIKAAVVKALTDNSGIVLVGGSGDRPWYESVGSAQGLILAAGEAQSKDVNDFSAIYVVAQVSGDKVCFEGVN